MNRILVLIAALALAGCTSAPSVPTSALVPVATGCKSAQGPLPLRPAEKLPNMATWSYKQKATAIASNRQEWIGYGDALRTKLEACK